MGFGPLYHRSVRVPPLLPTESPAVTRARGDRAFFSSWSSYARVAIGLVLLSFPVALWACAPLADTPARSATDKIGEPAPTAITSAVPLWLSNDPTRKAPPAGAGAEVAAPPTSVIEDEDSTP